VSARKVAIDPNKTAAIRDWLTPQVVKELRGFLGLAGYYRKFIRGFSIISNPLVYLLKKNSFSLDITTQRAFKELKMALCEALILASPDFTKLFIEGLSKSKGNDIILFIVDKFTK
jgi:hypothetical protein